TCRMNPNLQALEQKDVDAYVATGKDEKLHKIPLEASERKLVKADFQYHEAGNTFTCPAGQVLVMISESKAGERVYQGRADPSSSQHLKLFIFYNRLISTHNICWHYKFRF
ncbi:MAG: hypothetical protein IPP22_10480, partial [Nitrosomonas sp.]|nr:hypothetical protein [Nitrosomonas sp.]